MTAETIVPITAVPPIKTFNSLGTFVPDNVSIVAKTNIVNGRMSKTQNAVRALFIFAATLADWMKIASRIQPVRKSIKQIKGVIPKRNVVRRLSLMSIGRNGISVGPTLLSIPKTNEITNSCFAPLRSGEKSNITFPMNVQIPPTAPIPIITNKKEPPSLGVSCNPPAITPQINKIIIVQILNKRKPAPLRQRYN